jgi:aminopeptidase N
LRGSYLGEETFSRGLNRYLNRHIYNNTVTEDLWAALTELTGKPIVTLMDPWVRTCLASCTINPAACV